MSKISDLAKSFQQNSQQEAKNIEQQAKSDIQELRRAIYEELKQSEQKITADIRAQQIRMSRAVFKPYLWSLAGICTIGLTIITVLSMAIWKKNGQLSEIRERTETAKQALALLEDKTSGLILSTCKTQTGEAAPCVATLRNSGEYGTDKTIAYRLIPQNSR